MYETEDVSYDDFTSCCELRALISIFWQITWFNWYLDTPPKNAKLENHCICNIYGAAYVFIHSWMQSAFHENKIHWINVMTLRLVSIVFTVIIKNKRNYREPAYKERIDCRRSIGCRQTKDITFWFAHNHDKELFLFCSNTYFSPSRCPFIVTF